MLRILWSLLSPLSSPSTPTLPTFLSYQFSSKNHPHQYSEAESFLISQFPARGEFFLFSFPANKFKMEVESCISFPANISPYSICMRMIYSLLKYENLTLLKAPNHFFQPILPSQLHNLFFLHSLSILFSLCPTLGWIFFRGSDLSALFKCEEELKVEKMSTVTRSHSQSCKSPDHLKSIVDDCCLIFVWYFNCWLQSSPDFEPPFVFLRSSIFTWERKQSLLIDVSLKVNFLDVLSLLSQLLMEGKELWGKNYLGWKVLKHPIASAWCSPSPFKLKHVECKISVWSGCFFVKVSISSLY